MHIAVDTRGYLPVQQVTLANRQGRAQVEQLAERVQEVTGEHIKLTYVDQGYTGAAPGRTRAGRGICVEVVKHAGIKRIISPVAPAMGGETQLPLGRDNGRLAKTVPGFHYPGFVEPMLARYPSLADKR